MADSAQIEGRNGGGSGKLPEQQPTTTSRHPQGVYSHTYAHARAYEHALVYTRAQALVSLGVEGSGLLALLLSTVILLGGYIQSLGKEDFFCITVISMIQAAGIFKDWERSVEYLRSFLEPYLVLMANVCEFKANPVMINFMGFFKAVSSLVIVPLSFVVLCVELIYLLGPFACTSISSWRIVKLNHGNRDDGTHSMADMMAALNMFYSLVIFQGAMFGVLLFSIIMGETVIASHLLELEQLSEKWGKDAIRNYIVYVRAKCRKDPVSIKGRDLIQYGAELLDSESQEDFLYGARLLNAFVKKGEDVSWVLLPSRHRIQRLIDSLRISSSSCRLDETCVQLKSLFCRGKCLAMIGNLDDKMEIRELAAAIVANVAAHIDDLSKYPGAMRCISSLFQDQEETTQTYRNRDSKQVPDDPPQHQQGREEDRHRKLMMDQQRMVIRENKHRHQHKREGGTSNELVQQGLTILERLASNSDNNRRIICSTAGLLPKITAPVYSATLIEDVKTRAWADIVTRCLKVLYQLILAPAVWTSRRLRHEISSDVQALSNLKSIILDQQGSDDEADHQEQELQMVAMKILTELALDLSINLNEEIKKVLVTKQLQIFFLANGDGAAMVGRTLVSLSTNSESNSALIMTTQDGIIGRLTEILDDKKNIMQKTIAVEIMANLFAHCNVDNMKEILQKVLREIMLVRRKSQQRKLSAGQNNPTSGDEENQRNSVCMKNTEEKHKIYRCTQGDDTELEEISGEEREEQEAFLSLAQVICDKLGSADLDGAIQNAVQNEINAGSEEQRREAFVDKLKTIIDQNCHAKPHSLRILKLCGQIAKSVMSCEQYVEIFRNKGFQSSLSEASKTMAELESCMLFVGTDFGFKKTVRPLFSEIEKTFSEIEDN